MAPRFVVHNVANLRLTYPIFLCNFSLWNSLTLPDNLHLSLRKFCKVTPFALYPMTTTARLPPLHCFIGVVFRSRT